MNLKSKIKALELKASRTPYQDSEKIPGLIRLPAKITDPAWQEFAESEQKKKIAELKGESDQSNQSKEKPSFILKKGKKVLIKQSTENKENKEPLSWWQQARRKTQNHECGIIPLPSPMNEDEWEKYAVQQQQELIEFKRKELGE